MMKKSMLIILVTTLFSSMAFAGEIAFLVKKLKDKEILTETEAKQILILNKEKQQKQLTQTKGNLPQWTQKLKFNGDLRLRYQNENKGTYERERLRMRFRFQGAAEITDGLSVFFGLASGGANPRSTNQDMGETFSTKTIQLDYVYANLLCPITAATILAGKIPNKKVIWQPSDLLWDADISMDGFALNKTITDNFSLNLGYMLLEKHKTINEEKKGNATMSILQPTFKHKTYAGTQFKLAGTIYSFANLKAAALTYSSASNTYDKDGRLKYNYDSYSIATELTFYDLIYSKLAFFGEYIKNPDPIGSNEGYLLGLKFGDKEVKTFGDWQIKAMYRELQQDAWLDAFPDADTGNTDNQGIELALKIGLKKNMHLAVDYYYIGEVDDSDNSMDKPGHPLRPKSLIQIDLGFKF
ncbi:MAG: hypothetical protein GY817_02010 [bacterium]|nr:hypothetical protein [bacterium]